MHNSNRNPVADKNAVVSGDRYRITVITSCLVRLEYNETGDFFDKATLAVTNRRFPVPEYTVSRNDGLLQIDTSNLSIRYNEKEFSSYGLQITIKGNFSAYGEKWFYGQKAETLKGTARTLDKADGEIEIGDGVISKNGFTVYDDSDSFAIDDNGELIMRASKEQDIYFFGYGHDYEECIRDFYFLSGRTPLIPRYTLGNWWSRFTRYSEDSYNKLLNDFAEHNIPFSMAVLDMDWHVTEVDKKYGSGWTAYTWNKDLFPNPERFLTNLHNRGLHVTLNEHPAGGVRGFEDNYEDMAKALNVDYKNEKPIEFNFASKEYRDAYFKYLHQPNENIGVDFWWIDWQQGNISDIPGLDPLWLLNYYCYKNLEAKGGQAVVFSRYAGVGSHRYPIGFSGDTMITWESLKFQPYFTSTASNIGYSWWSHDIGGHMGGTKDDELECRWFQFGVFSPIMRIHSSSSPFLEKMPWKFKPEIENTMTEFLQLRHQLVPYLYTMNMRTSQYGEPLMKPMYYKNPDADDAYRVPNEYYFGNDMIVCPIVTPASNVTESGSIEVYIPEGTYYDFFTGTIYTGGRRMVLHRNIHSIPVLVRQGAIIPMTAKEGIANEVDNPAKLLVKIFAGSDGIFNMYEDNLQYNDYLNMKSAYTDITYEDGSRISVQLRDDIMSVMPSERTYTFEINGVTDCSSVFSDDIEIVSWNVKNDKLTIVTSKLTGTSFRIMLEGMVTRTSNDLLGAIFNIIDVAKMPYFVKDMLYITVKEKIHSIPMLISELSLLQISQDVKDEILEIVTACV